MKKLIAVVSALIALVYGVHQIRLRLAENTSIEKRNAVIDETNECIEVGEWKCAERNLQILLNESPDDRNLQLHMANVIFEQERYEDCVAYIAGLGYSNQDLEFLVKKSQSLIQEMEHLGLERSYHFRVEFDGSPSRNEVLEALSVLEVAYDSLCGLFEFYPENKLSVVLHEAAGYGGIGIRPDWVGAVFDGKLRVPVNLMQNREVYRPVLIHELTHAFVRSMNRTKIPLWLNEGIAQVVDASRNDVPRPAGEKPSLSALTEPFVKESRKAEAVKLYWYSQRMVEGMLRRNSSFAHFKDFMQELRKLDADDALQKYYGTTSQQLLDEV